MKKPLSRPPSSHTKKSVSPAMDKKAVATAAASASPRTQHGKGMKRDRVSFTESETDLESLRLIRELQEQEFGLRRRAARV
jgi:F-box and leucine-rich repeat protein 10/11